MLSRQDFIFTIGYDGPSAVVDSQAKKRYGGLSTAALAEKGLFRAAWASAVYAGMGGNQAASAGEKALVIEKYNQAAGTSYKPDDSLERLFGVFPVEVKRAVIL
jgi:hypothetical protein